jgi:hypothetical protein
MLAFVRPFLPRLDPAAGAAGYVRSAAGGRQVRDGRQATNLYEPELR